jgi:alkaline phosphatase/alkaline phosphatase D
VIGRRRYIAQKQAIILAVFFFVPATASAAALPTINDINQLSEKSHQIAEGFGKETFDLRRQYRFSPKSLGPADIERLRELAKTASRDLQAIVAAQKALKQQIEEYEDEDRDIRYGLTARRIKLAGDVYTTSLDKCEISLYLTVSAPQANAEQILHGLMVQINSLDRTYETVRSQLLKARILSLLTRIDPAYKPMAQIRFDLLARRSDIAPETSFTVTVERIGLLGPATPTQLSGLAGAIAESSRADDIELLLSLAALQRQYDAEAFEKTVQDHPQIEELVGSFILSELSYHLGQEQFDFEKITIFEAELAAGAAGKGNPKQHRVLFEHLASIERFRTPPILSVAAESISETSPTKAIDGNDLLLIQMAGEATSSSIILQGRFTQERELTEVDVPGPRATACFELSEDAGFHNSFKTDWTSITAERDFIIKQKVTNLRSGTRYYCRLQYGPDTKKINRGSTCTFTTLDGPDIAREITFVVVTGMNYHRFHHGKRAYKGADKDLGYPALKTILDMQPDFLVGTGDNVYYDVPGKTAAQTQQQLRKKWREQFSQRRFTELFAKIPTYWEKDDHDYRYNDCDNTSDRPPSPELGRQTFLEQLPVADPGETQPVTYRSHRVNKLLQIWLVEGRDYRSPNNMPDGPDKTIWGKEQKRWLKETLLESQAAFKILISATPMIGPDDVYKKDNHTNPKGFRNEGQQFFSWLGSNGFVEKGFYLVCGDRHWQYHSISPSGLEEFSCGALVDANARMGRKPGDPKSTDPNSLITQLYRQKEASGGFLAVTVEPGLESQRPSIRFAFYDENGSLLYRYKRAAGDDTGQ